MALKNNKKRRNKYPQIIQSEIDLHGLTKNEAGNLIERFIKNSREKNYSRIRIITGKGLHSENGLSILNGYVKSILEKEGLKYSDSKLCEGGSGSIDVQL